jgi:FAD/FMN-containing dehydrogenase/Fe-S oxidoreductase
MVNTDASGKGSRVYGRTSQHIVALRGVLADGSPVIFGDTHIPGFTEPDAIAMGHVLLDKTKSIIAPHQPHIREKLPPITRSFTGYNVSGVLDTGSLIPLLCGSEGTLCILTRIAVKLQPIPKNKRLLIMSYPSFTEAMHDIARILAYGPTAIESIDENTLTLGRQDSAYPPVAHLFGEANSVHLVEFSDFLRPASPSEENQENKVQRASLFGSHSQNSQITELLSENKKLGITTHLVTDLKDQNNCWNLRKRAVGLLLRLPGKAKPVAFIEDTVVPPENLAAYISELRTLLDSHGLFYAMYGHADVGCVHVRPALDLQKASEKDLFTVISDQVYALVKSHGGLLWGEHGKGIRGQYSEDYLGPELHHLMRQIKTLFDPGNRLNPGKLYIPVATLAVARLRRATASVAYFKGLLPLNPIRTTLYPLQSPMKADRDRDIPEALQNAHAPLIACNGNGACFSINQADKMCPSFKATHNRIDSPKGRAGLLKEWLRSHAVPEDYPTTFTNEIKDTLDRCLSCKGCTLTCPAQVDIPETRSVFLEHYYRSRRRPLRDYAFAMMETILPWMSTFPVLSNRLMTSSFSQFLLSQLGISDAPKFKENGTKSPPNSGTPTVMIIPDIFSHYLDAGIGQKTHAILTALGETALTLPFIPHGKAQHVLGMRGCARKIAKRQITQITKIQAKYGDIPIIVLEPGVASMYQHEYPALCGIPTPEVQSLGAFLAKKHPLAPLWQDIAKATTAAPATLFPHCMETDKESQAWAKILTASGQPISVTKNSCCGMAGLFGHQTEQKELSKRVFETSGAPSLEDSTYTLATGYSCRSQIQRFSKITARHPIEVLYEAVIHCHKAENGSK